MNWKKGAYYIVAGVLLLTLAAFLGTSSLPRSFQSQIASLMAIGGLIGIIWGVVKLKKAKERAKREKRSSRRFDT